VLSKFKQSSRLEQCFINSLNPLSQIKSNVNAPLLHRSEKDGRKRTRLPAHDRTDADASKYFICAAATIFSRINF
jgi:hypothetical protein